MPTGYTADIQKGISFEQYALNCSRAFGALIVMRDEPSDAEIPDQFKPSDYHLKAGNEAKQELIEIELMTAEEVSKKALADFNKAEAYRLKKIDECIVIEDRYNEMLVKAHAWTSPSNDHDKLKEFMISQIKESIKFDCGDDYYQTPAKELTGEQWRSNRLISLHESIARHVKGYSEEVDRTNGRNEWIELLRDSLKETK